jgi:iron-sulfur cluster assembly protein
VRRALARHGFTRRWLGYANCVLELTEQAVQAIERILATAGVPDGAGIRLLAVAPEDGAVTSELEVEIARRPADGDEVVEDAGARLFFQKDLCGYLADKLLHADLADERFRFSLTGKRG